MTLSSSLITKGFIAAGLANLSILINSRFFTNEAFPETDPNVFSYFGILMIVLWGLAYLSVARTYPSVQWLVGVFAVEKLVYGITWTRWITSNSVAEVFDVDAMAGVFFSIYGIIDWTACVFFTIVFLQLLRSKQAIS